MIHEDGSVIPAGIEEQESPLSHDRMFGIYKGIIKDIIFPEDENSFSKDRLEYIVRVNGQDYPNAIDIRKLGGRFNYSERTRDITKTNIDDGNLKDGSYDEKTDGEVVWVMFVQGNGDFPLIIAGSQHHANRIYHKPSRDDYPYDIEEFNGIEFKTDKDGAFSITHVGIKDAKGEIVDEKPVDSIVKMHSNGDLELNTHGTQTTSDLRIRMTKDQKKIEIYAQDNKIIADEIGILIHDKQNNKIVLDATGILIFDKNGNKITHDPSGIVIEDKNGNKTTNDSTGIEIEDKNGNKITKNPTGIKIEDTQGNKIVKSPAGIIVTDMFMNNIVMGPTGITLTDLTGNIIAMTPAGIIINSTANKVTIDGSKYELHQHTGNLGIATGIPLDAASV